ncbi:hypothetical protein EXIGLDRAFT_731573 [Exidia glandulosa HHB12029]|uniref:Uncharacterized protein n=1 Tax=Exidia glandulosa HHB12029 TaxID=1314781 RepID=A0A165BTU4_EXIGL|nr:hypothetical protein EXIGLDRAFT_731573 [Exidia glandulosa HHB12029]
MKSSSAVLLLVVPIPAKVLRSGLESNWRPYRPAYDKVAHRILLYGDPTRPHEATVASLRSLLANAATAFFAQLGQTADSDFNHFTPGDRFQSLFQFLGASTCEFVTSMKQADELVQVRGVDRQRRVLALEVAFSNESSGSAANETLAWIESGRVDFALTVKIEKNPDNQYDPFITVFYADCRERRLCVQESSTPATRQVIHEWTCGSGSGIAPQAGPQIK